MKSIKVSEYSRSRSFHDDLILLDQASGERSQDQWSSGILFLTLLFGVLTSKKNYYYYIFFWGGGGGGNRGVGYAHPKYLDIPVFFSLSWNNVTGPKLVFAVKPMFISYYVFAINVWFEIVFKL